MYVNGTTRPIQLGMSKSGAASPSAILDSGTPVIITTTAVANAIYGAIGISPSSDGMCTFSSSFRDHGLSNKKI